MKKRRRCRSHFAILGSQKIQLPDFLLRKFLQGLSMHVVVAWHIRATGPRERQLRDALKSALDGHSWVRPLSDIYIVKIADADDRASVRQALINVCEANRGLVRFIMSPAMTGGSYSGWLPKDLWDKINERTS